MNTTRPIPTSTLRAILTATFCATMFAFDFTIPMETGSLLAQEQEVVIRGVIRNGTTGRRQQADELHLIRLQGGMQVLQIIGQAGPDFAFDPAPGDAPLLIRARYAGATYTRLVPPAPRFQSQSQEVLVFEAGAKRADITITPLYQLVNAPEGLKVSKIYAIENNSQPPRSFQGGAPLVYVPEGAAGLQSQLRNPDSQMPVPVELRKAGRFYESDRAFRPGRSLLYVDFTVSARDFTDMNPAQDGESYFAIYLWRPEAAKPSLSGGESELIEIPNEGAAYRVRYPADGGVRIRTDDRNFYFENPMAAHENAFLNSPLRTTIAIVVALSGFFFFISLLATILRSGRAGA